MCIIALPTIFFSPKCSYSQIKKDSLYYVDTTQTNDTISGITYNGTIKLTDSSGNCIPIYYYNCDSTIVPISLTFSVDISNSMNLPYENYPRKRMGVLGLNICKLLDLSTDEFAIQTCDDSAIWQVNSDSFTQDPNQYLNFWSFMPYGNNNDFYQQILGTGTKGRNQYGCLNIASQGWNKKEVLLITDGIWGPLNLLAFDSALTICRQNHIHFNTVIVYDTNLIPYFLPLYDNGIKNTLLALADSTGGFFYENIATDSEVRLLAPILLHQMETSEICDWKAIIPFECNEEYKIIHLHQNNSGADTTFKLFNPNFKSLSINDLQTIYKSQDTFPKCSNKFIPIMFLNIDSCSRNLYLNFLSSKYFINHNDSISLNDSSLQAIDTFWLDSNIPNLFNDTLKFLINPINDTIDLPINIILDSSINFNISNTLDTLYSDYCSNDTISILFKNNNCDSIYLSLNSSDSSHGFITNNISNLSILPDSSIQLRFIYHPSDSIFIDSNVFSYSVDNDTNFQIKLYGITTVDSSAYNLFPRIVTFNHSEICNQKDSIILINSYCRILKFNNKNCNPNDSILVWITPFHKVPWDTTIIISYDIASKNILDSITIEDDTANIQMNKSFVSDVVSFDSTNRCNTINAEVIITNPNCGIPIILDSNNTYFTNKKFSLLLPDTIWNFKTIQLFFDPNDQPTSDTGSLIINNDTSLFFSVFVAPYRIIKINQRSFDNNNDWTVQYFPEDSIHLKEFYISLQTSSPLLIFQNLHYDTSIFKASIISFSDNNLIVEFTTSDWITINKDSMLFSIDGYFFLGTDSVASVEITDFEVNQLLTQFTSCIESVIEPDSTIFHYIPSCGTPIIKQLMLNGVIAFQIVPNPSSGEITFKFKKDVPVVIYDNNGKQVGTATANNKVLLDLPSGVYYAVIQTDEITKISRFVIQK